VQGQECGKLSQLAESSEQIKCTVCAVARAKCPSSGLLRRRARSNLTSGEGEA
jgi:hypothetical protein